MGATTRILWRPTGPVELRLVEQSGWTRWPPRLADQPIFYPVLNEWYATKIAREWNVPASGVGHVTRFAVRTDFLDRYQIHQAGGRDVLEYWIPAEDLEELNGNIVGRIRLVSTHTPDGQPEGNSSGRPLHATERVAPDHLAITSSANVALLRDLLHAPERQCARLRPGCRRTRLPRRTRQRLQGRL